MTVSAALPSQDGRLYPARPILAASLAVLRGDRVLLAKRTAPPLAGRFTLPGGLVELGETLAEAAVRELREEVAIEARILGFNGHVEVVERDVTGAVCRHYVIASFVGPEADDVIWASRDEIAALPTTAHLPQILDAAWAVAQRHS